MIERAKAWVRHKLGWKTPTEVINSIDIGKCIDEGISNYQRHQALNSWVESGMIEVLGRLDDDEMEEIWKLVFHGEDDCNA